MVGLPVLANGEEFRGRFVADDDQPLLRLLVFLSPNITNSESDAVLLRIAEANARLDAGAFFLRKDGELTFYTSTILGTDDPLPTQAMITTAIEALNDFLPFIRQTAG